MKPTQARMTDDELRALVREAVARHLRQEPTPATPTTVVQPVRPGAAPIWRAHPSFGRFLLERAEDDTACLIEPGVTCNHCGYCQSYGH